ncbi:hypothetical protein FB567DRAFT_456273 [Paraphoma chrysanthemicola]|uniref:Uncharacterized protein n=1 Tax=Paraphoma chrysanthemicola TaxID=798071 RepID=A0A8K0VS83_9PLEO|nr:hypothetical protein FB567DRAFT_456273 [Paraphoma chrysanthemicola]
MTTPVTKNTLSASSSKHETAKQWLQRRLRKQSSAQSSKDSGPGGIRDPIPIQRPRTAPSTREASQMDTVSAEPPIPGVTFTILQPIHSPSDQRLPHQTRPDSGVVRDVNAWLDASMSVPSPPLMAGLTYWRTTTDLNAQDSASAQHAIPIVRRPDFVRPSASHGQPTRPVRRRARKIGVQMPSLTRSKSGREAARKITNGRSNSVPTLAIPYEATRQGDPPAEMTQWRPFLVPATYDVSRTEIQHTSRRYEDVRRLEYRAGYESPASTCLRTSDGSNIIEQGVHAFFIRSSKSGDSTRSSGADVRMTRENSLGDISEAPTYWSGPPPPSYRTRSRTASILTTSSFGCIDGMTAEQRQISQQRAAHKRSMKGKLKRFAQNLAS